jgi:DNA-binding transcriptional ArsR family regulator
VSIKIMTAVWQICLPIPEKLLLLALADNANDEGSCYPSIANLARKCSMHRATVMRALVALEGQGHITRTRRQLRSTIYRVCPSAQTGSRAERLVADSDQSHTATTPVAESDSGSRTLRPTPSQTATHNRQRTVKEPSLNRPAARPRAATAARLPENFELTEGRLGIASREGIDGRREFAKFCDHWRAASGANARKHDWDAAWRNWCRKAADMKPVVGPGRATDPALAVLRELIASGGSLPPRTHQIQAAIEVAGGWPAIQQHTRFERPQIERKFCEGYHAWTPARGATA